MLSSGVAFGVLELLVGGALIAAGHAMSRRAPEKRGLPLVLRFLGVLLTLYGLLQVLFAVV